MKRLIITAICILSVAVFVSSCRSSAVVVSAPPPRPVYVRPVAPAPGYVWIEGNYIRSGRGYVYRPGYWVAPAPRYKSYRQGYWAPSRRGYRWVPGRW